MQHEATTDTEARLVLAEAIARRRQDIERRWLEVIRAELVDRVDVSLTELRDGIGDYLARLALSLRGDDPMNQGGAAAWAEVAREHAITRVRLGFDIDQLVREFIVLRRVLVAIMGEEHLAGPPHVDRLTDLIEAAISAAVKSYVDSRNYAARREEAEHIGFITHELRSPLATALLANEQLREVELPTAQRRVVELLGRNLDRLKGLIDSVLLAEGLEAKSIEAHVVDADLVEVLQPALLSMCEHARVKGLRLVTHIDEDAKVRVDPSLTTSIVGNLLDNAIKYTDTGTIELATEGQADEVVVHVRDNCDGISDEELRTMFEPFRRGRGQSRATPGAGLGLTIARRAAEAQGGIIGAESPGERGCHFWFTLRKASH